MLTGLMWFQHVCPTVIFTVLFVNYQSVQARAELGQTQLPTGIWLYFDY